MDEIRSRSIVHFRLDADQLCLWRGMQRIALRPKDCAVLQYLAERAGHLVTKAELFEAVWPDTFVTETVLKACIHRLRQVLGDSPRRPRCIETIPKRGYRFIDTLFQTTHAAARTDPSLPRPSSLRLVPSTARMGVSRPVLVGRQDALHRLQQWLEHALLGRHQIGFVTGEAGIGKTTVIEAFLAGLESLDGIRLMRGQCLEQYGAGEAYLAVFEALSLLCRSPGQEICLATLRQYAPTWVAQMPWLLSAAERQAQQLLHLSFTRDRMLREMTEALAALAASAPLVLVLEDLHWSDYATLDLIAWLARRQDQGRLLLLGTYRPEEATAHGHPLHTIIQTLRLRQRCNELALGLFDIADVGAYLAGRFPDSHLPAEAAEVLHQHSDGHPLFLVNLVDHLEAQGWLRQRDARREWRSGWQQAAGDVPDSLRQMVVHRITLLQPEEQLVLDAASVAGMEFSAASLAAALEIDIIEAERRCEGLAQQGLFLQPRGVSAWPDGTIATQYGFIHALYRNVVYQRLTAARRLQLHRRIGTREEHAYGEQAGDIAARLAMHFEYGHDHTRAIQYHRQAALNAMQRAGYQEAILHLRAALALLDVLPSTPARTADDLALQHLLGLALATTQGYAAAEAAAAYNRARRLCDHVQDSPQIFPVLLGLWAFYLLSGALRTAHEVAHQLLDRARRLDDPAGLLTAHEAMGLGSVYLGELTTARAHLEQGLRLYDPNRHRHLAFLHGQDVGVALQSHLAWALWLLGYAEQADTARRAALTLAQELAHPFSQALALSFAALLSNWCREPQSTREHAEAVRLLATEHGFAHWAALGTILCGWASAQRGEAEAGLAQLQQGLAAWRQTGARQGQPHFLMLLAEVFARQGHPEAGLQALHEALGIIADTGENWLTADLHRLEGELLLQLSGTPAVQTAEQHFRRALAIARHQQARLPELRAATSLSRLWYQQGKSQGAQRLLAPVYTWFREGLATPDLEEARELLDVLS